MLLRAPKYEGSKLEEAELEFEEVVADSSSCGGDPGG
jgi:hypothetical protein